MPGRGSIFRGRSVNFCSGVGVAFETHGIRGLGRLMLCRRFSGFGILLLRDYCQD